MTVIPWTTTPIPATAVAVPIRPVTVRAAIAWTLPTTAQTTGHAQIGRASTIARLPTSTAQSHSVVPICIMDTRLAAIRQTVTMSARPRQTRADARLNPTPAQRTAPVVMASNRCGRLHAVRSGPMISCHRRSEGMEAIWLIAVRPRKPIIGSARTCRRIPNHPVPSGSAPSAWGRRARPPATARPATANTAFRPRPAYISKWGGHRKSSPKPPNFRCQISSQRAPAMKRTPPERTSTLTH